MLLLAVTLACVCLRLFDRLKLFDRLADEGLD
jgi:hypothetical protein